MLYGFWSLSWIAFLEFQARFSIMIFILICKERGPSDERELQVTIMIQVTHEIQVTREIEVRLSEGNSSKKKI